MRLSFQRMLESSALLFCLSFRRKREFSAFFRHTGAGRYPTYLISSFSGCRIPNALAALAGQALRSGMTIVLSFRRRPESSALLFCLSFRRRPESRKEQFVTSAIFFISVLFCTTNVQAIDFSGRAALAANTYQSSAGDFGYTPFDDTLSSNQQSFRLMFEYFEKYSASDSASDSVNSNNDNFYSIKNMEWLFHIKTYRQEFSGFTPASTNSSDLFRIKRLSNARANQFDIDGGTRFVAEVDLASVLYRADITTWSVGRQSLDWGTGRLWQPMNVFGAFAATDLDTDYKAGIDSALMNYYPTAFSSLTVAAVFSPDELATQNENYAAFYRQQVGNSSELSLLLAQVLEDNFLGAALEGDFSGIGWRVEAVQMNVKSSDENELNWIAGMDYQFNASTIATLEIFHNASGVTSESDIASQLIEPRVTYGLQQHLSERLFGVALQHEINPLLNASYSLLASSLEDIAGENKHSFLHQLSFLYSVDDNADLMLAFINANGKGLNALGVPQSEFGHLSKSASLRFRYYF